MISFGFNDDIFDPNNVCSKSLFRPKDTNNSEFLSFAVIVVVQHTCVDKK